MELSYKKRFNQFLSFLKDPDKNPHPEISLDEAVFFVGKRHSAAMVMECQEESIEFMKSGIINEGYLRGNQITPDIPVNRLELFILQVATAIHIAKDLEEAHISEVRLHLMDQYPQVSDELREACWKMLDAFDEASKIMLVQKLVRSDRIAHMRGNLANLMNDSQSKLKDEFIFDLTNELIKIFLDHFPDAPSNLIATHIHTIAFSKQNLMISVDAIRKKIDSLKKFQ